LSGNRGLLAINMLRKINISWNTLGMWNGSASTL